MVSSVYEISFIQFIFLAFTCIFSLLLLIFFIFYFSCNFSLYLCTCFLTQVTVSITNKFFLRYEVWYSHTSFDFIKILLILFKIKFWVIVLRGRKCIYTIIWIESVKLIYMHRHTRILVAILFSLVTYHDCSIND